MKKFLLAAFAALALAAPVSAAAPLPDFMDRAVIYEVNLRQGTASRDLKGAQRELPRLRDLGVDIVWLMPIHPISEKNRKGTLGSYYAVKDYKAVNPEFGTMEDLKEYVRTAHSLGMKVILDEVCNHTGCDNAWVTEHPEYYARNEKGEMFGPFDWTDTYKLDYSNPATREAMADALKFWLTEADIDGYRCDVAGEVPTDFWEWVRPQLEQIKPVFMLAESDKPELLNNAFDADYAWPMKDLFNDIAATQGVNAYAVKNGQKRAHKTAKDIRDLVEKTDSPKGAVHTQMVTNHDLNSWEGTEFERYGKGLGAFAVLSYTLPGLTMMYTGQEVGFDHPFEFFETDSVQPDYTANEITGFYKMLNSLKHNHKALGVLPCKEHGCYPAIEWIPTEKDKFSDQVVAFSRKKGSDEVVVIVNLSDKEAPLANPDLKGRTAALTEYFNGAPVDLPETLAPWQYLIYTK